MKLDLARFQKSRETRLSAGGHVFIIRRPSPLDVMRLGQSINIETATRFVVGWEDVNESDLLPGGNPEPVDFDAAIFALWLAERTDLWEPLVKGIVDAYRQFEEAQENRGNV